MGLGAAAVVLFAGEGAASAGIGAVIAGAIEGAVVSAAVSGAVAVATGGDVGDAMLKGAAIGAVGGAAGAWSGAFPDAAATTDVASTAKDVANVTQAGTTAESSVPVLDAVSKVKPGGIVNNAASGGASSGGSAAGASGFNSSAGTLMKMNADNLAMQKSISDAGIQATKEAAKTNMQTQLLTGGITTAAETYAAKQEQEAADKRAKADRESRKISGLAELTVPRGPKVSGNKVGEPVVAGNAGAVNQAGIVNRAVGGVITQPNANTLKQRVRR